MAWTLPETPWLLLYPGTWFGSYLELASGDMSARTVFPAIASVALMAFMASKLGGRLSLEYSERLGAMTTAARVKASASGGRGRAAFWFTTGEARAVALLVRSQFRHDHRFRMGVLGLLPFTLLYMWIGIRDGAIVDPFTPGRGMQAWPVTMAVLTAPAMLRMQLTHSDSFQASWIFFTSPGDRMKIARSSKDVLVVFFLVPYLLLVFGIYTYVVGHVGHVLVHVTFLGLCAHLVLQLALLIDPTLPFSKPMLKGRGTSLFFAFTVATVGVSGFIQFYSARLYSSTASTLTAVAGILVAGVIIDRLTRARVDRQTRLLEFEG